AGRSDIPALRRKSPCSERPACKRRAQENNVRTIPARITWRPDASRAERRTPMEETMAVRDRWSRIFAFGVLALSAALAAPRPAAAANEHFKEVLQNGVLRVGVQGALRPWSYRDPKGNLVGIEPDLARDVADTMGVKLELVQIESANRMQFLQQGRIDLLIGAMSDTPERRKVVGIIHPDYWISGTNVLAKKGAVKSWEDLR